MKEIYDKTFVTELKFGPSHITDLCTGVVFDGQYFHLGYLDVFSRMVVEKAKGSATTGAEVDSFVE
jgi:hypothetical protein